MLNVYIIADENAMIDFTAIFPQLVMKIN